MGPWTHFGFGSSCGDVDFGPDAELDYGSLQLAWFRHTLEGGDASGDPDRPVRIFVMGGGEGTKTADDRLAHGGRWRDEQEWPLRRAEDTEYFLASNGTLSEQPPATSTPPSSFAYDPRDPVPTVGGVCYFMKPGETEPGQPRLFIPYGPQDQREQAGVFGSTTNQPLAERSDVLVFETRLLERDVEVTGTPVIHLSVSSSAIDTDFAAKLVDVYPPSADYPGGYALNLADGIMRARYRLGFERPEFLTPGEVYELTLRLYATSNLFKAGHRIRIMVSSSDYPAYDPNPNNGATLMDTSVAPVVAVNTVYHDAERPSRIVLPIVADS